jgi:Na+-translocating ferredoxin:NAD+ oxidoreductase RnfD subunit
MASTDSNIAAAKPPLSVLSLPRLTDPRYLQLSILLGYALVAREVFHMDRPHWITLSCIALALVFDSIWGAILYRVVRFPISALIIGLATSLLLDSRYPAVYFIAVFLGITSKALITYKGNHLFNPANFGVVCVLMLAPTTATGMPALFGGYMIPSIIFFILGTITVLYARQAWVSFSWIAAFLIFAELRALLLGKKFFMMAMPLLSPSFLLFTFHMISDPATSPREKNHKIVYGVCIAAMDAAFRFYQIPYGNFYSLFFVTALMPWMRDWERNQRNSGTVPA